MFFCFFQEISPPPSLFSPVFQGVVIGTGENSQFGEVFKMMQAEEVTQSLAGEILYILDESL